MTYYFITDLITPFPILLTQNTWLYVIGLSRSGFWTPTSHMWAIQRLPIQPLSGFGRGRRILKCYVGMEQLLRDIDSVKVTSPLIDSLAREAPDCEQCCRQEADLISYHSDCVGLTSKRTFEQFYSRPLKPDTQRYNFSKQSGNSSKAVYPLVCLRLR